METNNKTESLADRNRRIFLYGENGQGGVLSNEWDKRMYQELYPDDNNCNYPPYKLPKKIILNSDGHNLDGSSVEGTWSIKFDDIGGMAELVYGDLSINAGVASFFGSGNTFGVLQRPGDWGGAQQPVFDQNGVELMFAMGLSKWLAGRGLIIKRCVLFAPDLIQQMQQVTAPIGGIPYVVGLNVIQGSTEEKIKKINISLSTNQGMASGNASNTNSISESLVSDEPFLLTDKTTLQLVSNAFMRFRNIGQFVSLELHVDRAVTTLNSFNPKQIQSIY